MDNVTLIRVVAGVLFVVVFYILIQRRKKKMKLR
jgi:preprotein translocase subunit YajC